MEEVKAKKTTTIEDWKTLFADISKQLKLGLNDVESEYETQKSHLNEWLDQADDKLTELQKSGKEGLNEFRTSLDELKVQAALGKAEARDSMIEQQKELNLKIHNLNHEMEELYTKSEGEVLEFVEEFKMEFENYQVRFEILKIQMSHWKDDKKEDWQEMKSEIKEKLDEMQSKISENSEKASDSMDHFSDEMSKTWKHFKAAFSNKKS